MGNKVGWVHKKIKEAGIETVISVSEVGLEFAAEATPEEITAAQAIFDGYSEASETSEALVGELVDLQSKLDSIGKIKTDITVPVGYEEAIQARWDEIVAILNG